MARRRKKRKPYCLYCKRDLEKSSSPSDRAFTRDHLHPQSKGGKKWYPCCRACNTVKADLTSDEWRRFQDAHPKWWKLYPKTARQIGGF